MNQVRFKGRTHVLGGEEFIIPPLSLVQTEELENIIPLVQDTTKPLAERNALMRDIIGLAIKRNYPTFNVELLKDLLDLGNFREVLDSVLSRSGFKLGEPKPGEPEAPSTGAVSTQK